MSSVDLKRPEEIKCSLRFALNEQLLLEQMKIFWI